MFVSRRRSWRSGLVVKRAHYKYSESNILLILISDGIAVVTRHGLIVDLSIYAHYGPKHDSTSARFPPNSKS